VKRIGRDEPTRVAMHMCMKATLRISLYSYLYLKLAKALFFLLSLMFFLQQNQRTRAWNRFCPEAEGERELAQIMYTNVIKCKNDKMEF
jgi:hypothetical protein